MTSVPPAPTFLHGPTDGYAAAAVIDNVKPYFGTRPVGVIRPLKLSGRSRLSTDGQISVDTGKSVPFGD